MNDFDRLLNATTTAGSNTPVNSIYPEISYFRGHKGIHLYDGIYKIEEPYVCTVRQVFNPDNKDYIILADHMDYDINIVCVKYFVHRENIYSIDKLVLFKRHNPDIECSLITPTIYKGELIYDE